MATAGPLARLAATLGMAPPAAGDVVPPGWHCVYFGPALGPESLRPDGQSALPPVPLRRFRIGLDRVEFAGELRVGDALRRVSTITGVAVSERAEGPLVRLLQRNEISGPRGLAVVEERESIYFDAAPPDPGAPPRLPEPRWRRSIEPHAVLLFRYSALRFNSHRVHYDRDFAVREEGLPGVMVQAALLTQLLLELCRAELPSQRVLSFSARTRHPICDTGPFTLCGTPSADGHTATMWALDAAGSPALSGEIALA